MRPLPSGGYRLADTRGDALVTFSHAYCERVASLFGVFSRAGCEVERGHERSPQLHKV
ncbi:hypothetical protein RR46_04066 [Papilio xuthus]|uniref:Uncharacterized protein n=1 Tax=Papilio xuthus TaxID=66420 RepID=A0A194QJ42_PAPXU|nr:hypothetical protein RR46_04066 [Papilio xuthus]